MRRLRQSHEGRAGKIYYIRLRISRGESQSALVFRKKGIEVLLLSGQIDEWLVTHLTDFEGKQLQSVTKGDLVWAI
ncbi:MAG: hypothetical protein R3E08_12230 [Thiotrichaceae bacterium]